MPWWDRWTKKKPKSDKPLPTEGAKLLVEEQQDGKPVQGDMLAAAIGQIVSGQSGTTWYRKSSWIYACIRYIAAACSSVEWYVKQREANGEYKRVVGHPAERLLAFPNEFMSGQDLMEQSVGHLEERGNAIWYILRTINGVEELWPIDPAKIKPVLSRSTTISHYEFGKKKEPYQVRDIVHFKLMDPDNFFWGMSPLEPAGLLAECDMEALRWWRNSMRNRCVKDGLLAFKHDLTVEQHAKVSQVLRDQVLGSYSPRGPLVVGHEAQYTPSSMTPVELDYVKSRQMTKEELCVLFGIPSVLMIPDNSSYNNIKTARVIFWLDTIIPFLDNMRATLNTSLIINYLEKGQKPGDLMFDYDLSKVEALLESLASKVKIGLDLFQMGIPVNSIINRLQLGIPEVEGGDIGCVTSVVTPIGDVAAQAALEAAQQQQGATPEESLPKSPSAGQNGSGNGQAGNGKPAGKTPSPARNGAGSKTSGSISY